MQNAEYERRIEELEKRYKILEPLVPGVDKIQGENGDFSGIDYANNPPTPPSADKLLAYPIGSVYMSFVSTSPNDLFGGAWQQLTGRFLLPDNSSGSEGGARSVTLGIANMPSHAHSYSDGQGTGYQVKSTGVVPETQSPTANGDVARTTGYQGSGASFDITNSYVTVYCWKRVA